MGERIPLSSTRTLFNALEKHPAFQSLSTTLRWDRFRHPELSETPKHWLNVLGETAVVFTHMRYFSQITEDFIKKEWTKFNKNQRRTLRLGVSLHDVGEAKIDGIGIGDVAVPFKNESHEKLEWEVAEKVIKSLPNISDSLKKELLSAYKKVVTGEDPILHGAFKALEKTEYLMTGLNVFKEVRRLQNMGYQGIFEAKKLVGLVLAKDLPKIIEKYAPQYPFFIGGYLQDEMGTIDAAFASTESFFKKGSVDHSDFERSKGLWKDYKESFFSKR